MKANRKMWKIIKWFFCLLPIWVLIIRFVLMIFANFGYNLIDTNESLQLFNEENIKNIFDTTIRGTSFNLNLMIMPSISNVINWCLNNIFNGAYANLGVYSYSFYIIAWFIQCKLMFLIFDALLFFIDFAERMLNRTYRKE